MKKPLLSEMSLREKIGQCLLPYQWDIYGKVENGKKHYRNDDEIKEIINENQFGTMWVDQTNVHKVINLGLDDHTTEKVKAEDYSRFLMKQDAFAKIPCLRALDAESEGAGRIFGDLSLVCPPLAIGAADSEELTYELGRCVARELRCGGANWRWAPVGDISSRFNFGIMRMPAPDYPDRAIKLLVAQIRGMQSEGVAATIKHFPGGHRFGDGRDSHFCPNVNPLSMDEWWEEQGRIFQSVIDGGVYSVMVGHAAFPAMDDSLVRNKFPRPATVSKKIITDLLKGEMGFKGVVITDGIVMASLFACYDKYEDLIIDLINAGNDVILGSYLEAGEIIEKAVADGRIAESRIDDACQRVLDMKEKLGMFNDDYWKLPYKASDIVAETAKVNGKIARRAITLVRDLNSLLPMDKSKIKNVTIVCSAHVDFFFENLKHMKKAFEDRGATVRLQRRIQNSAEMQEIDQTSDLIIYAVFVGPHKPKGHMGLYGDEVATYLHALTAGREKSIGLSMGYPYIHHDILGNADTFINAYGSSPELMDAFVEAVYGEIEITGKSPVKLKPGRLIFTYED